MIYGGKLKLRDLLTLKIHQVEGTVFISVRIFVNKINLYRLKIIVSRILGVLNIQKWHLIYIYIYFQ